MSTNRFNKGDLRAFYLAFLTYPYSSLTQARVKQMTTVAGFALLWAAGIITETKQFLGFSIGASGFWVTLAALFLVLYATLLWFLTGC